MEPQHEERRLTTILSADVVGYSRLMGADEAGTFAQLKSHRKELLEPKTAEFSGRLVKLTGDGSLMEFGSVVDAVNFAVDVQRALAERNAQVPEDRRIIYRIGINIGDIIVDGDDIYGDGVNVAARLEGLAEPGGICISQQAFDQVETKLDLAYQDLGEQHFKNIARPIRVFQIVLKPIKDRTPESVKKLSTGLPDKPSIAVLPFANMSGDPEQEYFSDGIAEDIITELSRLRWFYVIARNSSFSYKDTNVDIKQVGRELGARYVLEGSVRKAGNRLRITGQLIDTASNRHIWADRYDGALDDVFDLQDQITRNIVQAIEPSFLAAESERAHRTRPENMEAWDLTIRALPYLWKMSETAFDEARILLERAIDLDPRYARAYSVLSMVICWKATNGWSDTPFDDYAEADRYALKSIELDPVDPWPYAMRSFDLVAMGEHDRAVVQARHAVALDPNCVLSRISLGNALLFARDGEGALAEIERVQAQSPRDLWMFLFQLYRGAALAAIGRHAEAAQALEQSVAERPDFRVAQILLACTYVFLDRLEDAQTTVVTLLRLVPNESINAIRARRIIRAPRYLDALRKAGLPEE